MNEAAKEIVKITGDYHSEFGYEFTAEKVIEWANQFEEKD